MSIINERVVWSDQIMEGFKSETEIQQHPPLSYREATLMDRIHSGHIKNCRGTSDDDVITSALVVVIVMVIAMFAGMATAMGMVVSSYDTDHDSGRSRCNNNSRDRDI